MRTDDYDNNYNELSKLDKESLIKLILKLKKLNSKLKGRLYRCEDRLNELEDLDSLISEIPDEWPIKDKGIGGTEIKIGIEFKKSDNREYYDIVSELSDNIIDTVEKSGHTFLICTSKPILKSELE